MLGQSASLAAGKYNLNGGLLSLSALTQAAGDGAFNFSGGTLQAAASFTTSAPIVLSAAGSNCFIDSMNNYVTLAGPLSGSGGFQKIDTGTLVLAASNDYTGITLVSGGTLLLANSAALAGSTFDNGRRRNAQFRHAHERFLRRVAGPYAT